MVAKGVEVKVPDKHHMKGNLLAKKVVDDPTGLWADG